MAEKKKGDKLTPELVAAIKAKKNEYPMLKNADLGRMFGYSESTVSKVLSGRYDDIDQVSGDVCDLLKAIDAKLSQLVDILANTVVVEEVAADVD